MVKRIKVDLSGAKKPEYMTGDKNHYLIEVANQCATIDAKIFVGIKGPAI